MTVSRYYQRYLTEERIELKIKKPLGSGGEGAIYAVVHNDTLVAKVYHSSRPVPIPKLQAMLALPPLDPMAAKGHTSIAWPIDLLLSEKDLQPIGFLMRRAEMMRSIHNFYTPIARLKNYPFFNYQYLHNTAFNLVSAINALHARRYVIGDVNANNILVANTTLVTLIDTDSFQIPDSRRNTTTIHRCFVGAPEYTPPELQNKNFSDVVRMPENDLFGLAVLIFRLFMEGTHPFDGVFQGVGDSPSIEASIKAGLFPYSQKKTVPVKPKPFAPSFNWLHPSLQRLFIQCFEDGHDTPQARPDTRTWLDVLQAARAALINCRVNSNHFYSNHLASCPWCGYAARLRYDPFPPPRAQPRPHPPRPRQPPSSPPPPPPPPARQPTPATLSQVVQAFPLGKIGATVFVIVMLIISFALFNSDYKTNSPTVETTELSEKPLPSSQREQITYVGIGIDISIHNPYLKIAKLFKGSPAERSNLKIGDIIVYIDDKWDVKTMTIQEVLDKIRLGTVGQPVKLSVRRSGYSGTIDIDLTQDEITTTISTKSYPNVKPEHFVPVPHSRDKMFESMETYSNARLLDNFNLYGLRKFDRFALSKLYLPIFQRDEAFDIRNRDARHIQRLYNYGYCDTTDYIAKLTNKMLAFAVNKCTQAYRAHFSVTRTNAIHSSILDFMFAYSAPRDYILFAIRDGAPKSGHIKKIQQALVELGFRVKSDGIWDETTSLALIGFIRSQNNAFIDISERYLSNLRKHIKTQGKTILKTLELSRARISDPLRERISISNLKDSASVGIYFCEDFGPYGLYVIDQRGHCLYQTHNPIRTRKTLCDKGYTLVKKVSFDDLCFINVYKPDPRKGCDREYIERDNWCYIAK